MQSFTVVIPEVEEATAHFLRTGSGISLAGSSPLRTSYSYSKNGEHFRFSGVLAEGKEGLGQIEHISGTHRLLYSGGWKGNTVEVQTLISDFFTYAAGRLAFQGKIYPVLSGSKEATTHLEIAIATFRVFLPVVHGSKPYLLTRDETEYTISLEGRPSTWFPIAENFLVGSLHTFVNQETPEEVVCWEKTIDHRWVHDQWTSLTNPNKPPHVSTSPHKWAPMYILTVLHPEIKLVDGKA